MSLYQPHPLYPLQGEPLSFQGERGKCYVREASPLFNSPYLPKHWGSLEGLGFYIKLSNVFIARYYSAILGGINDGRLAMTKLNKFWALIIILLVAIIAIGGIITWSRYSPSQPIEISLPPPLELKSEIYVGGAVNNPGFYPLKGGDSVGNIIQVAGGATGNADLSRRKLHVPESGETYSPQKIDINRAEAWILEALPGIGEVKAQAIINYRRQNGPFRNISELTKVASISITTYEQIKHLATVAD